MAISRTPKNIDTLFQPPTAQLFEDVDGEDNKQKENDRVAELEQALKDLRTKQEEERSDALLSQPTQWQSQVNQQAQYTEVKPESIELPDPALDPNGYDAALARRNEIRATNQRNRDDATRKRDDDIKAKTDDLWADFGDEYAEYIEGPEGKERIDYIATKVVQEAVRKNLDVQRYMFGSGRTRFMKDVVKKYNKVFGEPEAEDDEDTSDRRSYKARDLPRRRPVTRDRQEDDEGRSVGVFGGNEGGRPSHKRNVDIEEGPSMIDDLQTLQRKTGFF